MNLLEHETKTLLAAAGIAVPKGELVARDSSAPSLPVILKSQVPTGGRGKAGGVKIARDENEYQRLLNSIYELPIKGYLPATLLAEQLLDIDRELYLSMLVDRASMTIQVVAHRNGGVEVEDNENFQRWEVNEKSQAEEIGQALAVYFDLEDKTFILQDMIERLFAAFVENDALLIEINPLILTKQGELVAGDGKATLDDAATFRHDWHFAAESAEANFVTINPEGNVATIANGAGLAMATVDAAYDAGLIPANFLDIGGGASTQTLLKAFRRIVEYPNLEAIIINIFAGITRADEVAKAVVAAREQIDDLPPLFIRLAGTNYDAAKDILDTNDVPLLPTLQECLEAAKEVTHG